MCVVINGRRYVYYVHDLNNTSMINAGGRDLYNNFKVSKSLKQKFAFLTQLLLTVKFHIHILLISSDTFTEFITHHVFHPTFFICFSWMSC